MTNNFSTLKDNNVSEKFYLMRMKPGRSILNDLTLSSGTTYTCAFPFESLCAIEVNGVAYTRSLTTPNAGEFFFSEIYKVIVIKLPSAISNYLTSGNIVAYYYLFYTNDINKYFYEDPEDDTSAMRWWNARLKDKISFDETQENIIDSILTIGNTSIKLDNIDHDFNKYLTDKDSFSKKEVKIWQCIDSTDNIQRFYFGFINSLTIGKEVSLSIDNQLSALDEDLNSSTNHYESIFNITNYPNVHPDQLDDIIPRMYCLRSRSVDTRFTGDYPAYGDSYYQFDMEESFTLTNISYNASPGTTRNRTWAACFASTASSVKTDTIANRTVIDGTWYVYETDVTSSEYYTPGDMIELNTGSGYTGGHEVYAIISSTRIQIRTAATAVTNGNTIRRSAIPMIQFIDDNQTVGRLQYPRDYAISTDTIGVYNITLTNNFEANWTGASFETSGIQPGIKFIYRVYNHDSLDHGTVIQDLIERMGLEVNTASITAANATSIKTNFTIPYFKETSFPKAIDVLQQLLSSTFGYLYLDSDLKVGYKLVDAISSSDEITEDYIINSSLTQEIDYKDIYTSFSYENAQGDKTFSFTGGYATPTGVNIRSTIYLLSSEKNQNYYLHKIKKERAFSVITKDVTNSKDRIENVLSNRRGKFTFTTKGKNFSSMIGDDTTIVSNKIMGTAGEKDIKILGITKTAEDTTVVGIDLLGL